MATAQPTISSLSLNLKCPACRSESKNLKALPCFHPICEKCLSKQLRSATMTNNPQNKVQRFPCPKCLVFIEVPLEGAEKFPPATAETVDIARDSLNESNGLPPSYQSIFGDKAFDASGDEVCFVQNERSAAKFLFSFAQYGTNPHSENFLHISGLALSPVSDDIVVVDCCLNKVGVFSLSGKLKSFFFCECSIRDASVTPGKTILVTVSRSGPNIIHQYTFDGAQKGRYGDHFAHFQPHGIVLDDRGYVFITSLSHNKVQILTDQKRRSEEFGCKGSGPNHFLQPLYLCLNRANSRIIVSDAGNHCIKIYNVHGMFQSSFGQYGRGPGDFFYPLGVCVDKDDNIYVADSHNYRIQVFNSDGKLIGIPVQNTNRVCPDAKPVNVVVREGRMYVAVRGTQYCQVDVFDWRNNYNVAMATPSSSLCCGLLCCISSGKSEYEPIP